MPNYFIDCHCHMFTIADIPLYQSVFTFVGEKDKLHKKLIFPFVFPFAGVLLPIINLKKIVQSNEKFIRFFECEPGENVVPLCTEINACLDSSDFPASLGKIDEVILTPLVMDFDKGGGVAKLRGQVRRLGKAIEANKSQRVKILPLWDRSPQVRPAGDPEGQGVRNLLCPAEWMERPSRSRFRRLPRGQALSPSRFQRA